MFSLLKCRLEKQYKPETYYDRLSRHEVSGVLCFQAIANMVAKSRIVTACFSCSCPDLNSSKLSPLNYSNVIYILLPSEGRAGEAWDPSNEMTLFLPRSHPSPDRHEVSLSSPVTSSICSTIVRYVCFSPKPSPPPPPNDLTTLNWLQRNVLNPYRTNVENRVSS